MRTKTIIFVAMAIIAAFGTIGAITTAYAQGGGLVGNDLGGCLDAQHGGTDPANNPTHAETQSNGNCQQ